MTTQSPTPPAATPLLDVRHLSVDIGRGRQALRVVRDVSFTVAAGESVALVGESGSGKSMTAYALLNLFPTPDARIAEGQVLLDGQDLAKLPAAQLRALRGTRLGMVFQDPSSYLDPLMPVGKQIAEALVAHGHAGNVQERVLELIELMELPQPAQTARKYPHELSGGQRQRVLIAAALAMRPALLVADEPTTALDVTVQAEILRLLARLRRELGLGILLITHDLGVVAQTCQQVNVMYAGEIVESNAVGSLFAEPRHPYTQGLLASMLGRNAQAGVLFSMPGNVPIAGHWPQGCRLHPRCPIARHGLCDEQEPPRTSVDGATVRCHLAEDPRSRHAWETAA